MQTAGQTRNYIGPRTSHEVGTLLYDPPDHDAIFKGHPSHGAVFPKGASCTPQISPRPVKFADTLGETDETGRPIGSRIRR